MEHDYLPHKEDVKGFWVVHLRLLFNVQFSLVPIKVWSHFWRLNANIREFESQNKMVCYVLCLRPIGAHDVFVLCSFPCASYWRRENRERPRERNMKEEDEEKKGRRGRKPKKKDVLVFHRSRPCNVILTC